MKNFRILTRLLLVTVLGLGGCVSSKSVEPEVVVKPEVIEILGRYKKEYVLVPGDKIEVSVWRVPEVSRTVVVRPDGYISLPTLSNVQAAGLSFAELTDDLTRLFSVRLREPKVTIIAAELREPMVYVLGDVNNQRAVPLRSATTAIEAIASVGGAKRSGGIAEVSIIRLGEDGILRAIIVNPAGDGQPDPYLALSTYTLQAGDVLFVPETSRSEVVRFIDDFIIKPLKEI